jgi:hypothetical protein
MHHHSDRSVDAAIEHASRAAPGYDTLEPWVGDVLAAEVKRLTERVAELEAFKRRHMNHLCRCSVCQEGRE